MSRTSPYGPKKFASIDEYHANAPEEVRATLDKLRQIVVKQETDKVGKPKG